MSDATELRQIAALLDSAGVPELPTVAARVLWLIRRSHLVEASAANLFDALQPRQVIEPERGPALRDFGAEGGCLTARG